MTKNLTEGNPAKVIFFFTLPLILGNIIQQMYSLVDTLLVGRFLGVKALASVGCTGGIMFLVIGFVMGTTNGFSIKTGQFYGAKDERAVRRSVAAGIILSAGLSFLITFFGVMSMRPLLILMQTPAEILEGAVDFIVVVVGGISMMVFFALQTNLIRALGDSKMPTVLLAFSLILNVIFEPIVLLWFKWGIFGAALATIMAQFLGNIATIYYIYKRVPALHVRREDFNLTKEELFEHIRIGLPMGLQTSVVAIGAIILQAALNDLGAVAVAAYSAAQKVDMVATMPMMSFGMAMSAYTAQNYGARKLSRIREGVYKCMLMSGGFSIIAGILNMILGPMLMGFFVEGEASEVIRYGQIYLTITGCSYILIAMMFIFRYTLLGLGQTFMPTVAVFMELIMRAGAAVFLAPAFGYEGVCYASPLSWAGSCIPLAFAYYLTKKMLVDKNENLVDIVQA